MTTSIIESTLDIVASVFLFGGLFFMMVGAFGIVRFPDAYNRLHASSKCSTFGLLGLLLGAVFHIGTLAVTTKAILTLIFAFVATPVGSHILAKAAHMDQLRQWPKTLSDELADDMPERRGESERIGVDPTRSDGETSPEVDPEIDPEVDSTSVRTA